LNPNPNPVMEVEVEVVVVVEDDGREVPSMRVG
jgi:hypothetical protein